MKLFSIEVMTAAGSVDQHIELTADQINEVTGAGMFMLRIVESDSNIVTYINPAKVFTKIVEIPDEPIGDAKNLYEIDPTTGKAVRDRERNLVPKGEMYRVCEKCNYDRHECMGCGDSEMSHWTAVTHKCD